MRSVKKIFGFILGLVLLVGLFGGCAPSGQDLQDPSDKNASEGTTLITSHKFTPPDGVFTFPNGNIPKTPPVDDPSGEVVLDEEPPPPTEEEPPADTGHVIVSGAVIHSDYAGGDFLLEARGTAPCGEEVCADLTGKPFASVKVSQVGYFSLVVPRVDVALYLVATYSHPTDGTSVRDHPLGVLSDRVNGVTLDFSPEQPPEPPTPPGGPEDLTAQLEAIRENARNIREQMKPRDLINIL